MYSRVYPTAVKGCLGSVRTRTRRELSDAGRTLRRVASVSAVASVVLAVLACAAEPTATPIPTATATPTPTPGPPFTPLPTPGASNPMEVEFWELVRSSTGQDLIAFLTDQEAACVENELGANYQAMLEAPLVGEKGALLEEGGSDAFPLPRCFTVERAASMSLSLFSAAAGGLSAGTQECMLQLLTDDPAIVEALGQGQAFIDGPAILEVTVCLTPEEAAALTPPGDGPAPNPNDIACLLQELAGTSSGERIIAVLSGAYTSGKGLTVEESAALGQAVEACGIETEFEFPDPAATGATPGPTSDPAVAPRQCADWNTDGFFRNATLNDVTACLAGGSDPNDYGDFGNTPLHYAATGYNDDPEMIRALLAHGADPNAPAVTGVRPLHTAAALNGNPEVVAALLEGGADPQFVDGQGRLPVDLVDDNPRLTLAQKDTVRNALSQA